MGVHITMDDFGAGHSSLGYLQSFPFDKVKIDRAFVVGVERSCKSAAIVRAIADLCLALGMSTTIEGVETDEQFRAIARMGADETQGYVFSRPCPDSDVPRLLSKFGEPSTLICAAE